MICYLHVSIVDDVPNQDVQGGIAVDVSSRIMHSTA